MKSIVPLKFTSGGVEQEVRGICAVHGISFDYLEECFNENHVLIESGETYRQIDIGRGRLLENPSSELDELVMAWLSGAAFARESRGQGQRLVNHLPTDPDPLDILISDFRAQLERERWLSEII